ncbi:hypothetical protein IAI10_23815 [Clostridium sp. 19966]|uniref:hypothetical protein n=1 Tax=Clostridium sp. 19966 TaxID=2768166 RepID=UPI0028E04B50|nr:hypothetical protein [Clostridium sp. 19966]MDT8719668.1 hypothetical protein [Clostridium sp. 19966]
MLREAYDSQINNLYNNKHLVKKDIFDYLADFVTGDYSEKTEEQQMYESMFFENGMDSQYITTAIMCGGMNGASGLQLSEETGEALENEA